MVLVAVSDFDSWRNIAISNNVGGVKRDSGALRRALENERHF